MTKIFVDAADFDEVVSLSKKIIYLELPQLTLPKKRVSNYEIFAKVVISNSSLPLSLEVFSDEIDEMYEQALKYQNGVIKFMLKFLFPIQKANQRVNLLKNLRN